MKSLVDKKYLLERFQGKGGWTYARIDEIPQDKRAHFGWVKVRGTIDGFEIRKYHLMPMGDFVKENEYSSAPMFISIH